MHRPPTITDMDECIDIVMAYAVMAYIVMDECIDPRAADGGGPRAESSWVRAARQQGASVPTAAKRRARHTRTMHIPEWARR